MEAAGEYHYLLPTGTRPFDGSDYIVDLNCDTVCVFCFCPYGSCIDAYQIGAGNPDSNKEVA